MAGAIRTLFGEIFFKDNTSKALDDVNKGFDKTKNKALGLDDAIKAIGGMAFVNQVKNMVGSMIDASSEFEQTSVSMEVMTGSMETARKLVEDLEGMAMKTPFEASDLNRNATLLLNFGSTVDDILPSLQMLGDISGGNANKLNSLSLVFGQVKSQGNLMGQDLLQMINAGFNPLKTIFDSTGESMASLKDKMSKGLISFDMVQNAMKTATSEGGRFYKMMEKQGLTWAGLTSSISDMYHKILRSFGDVILSALKPLLPVIIDLMTGFVKFLKTERGIAIIKIGLTALAVVVGMVAFELGAMAIAAYGGAAAVWTMLLPFLAIAAGITAVILILEDLYQFFTGGESVIGDFLSWVADGFLWLLKSMRDYVLSIPIISFLIFAMKDLYQMFTGGKSAIGDFFSWLGNKMLDLIIFLAKLPFILIASVLAVLIILGKDLYALFTGGESMIGNFFSWIGDSIIYLINYLSKLPAILAASIGTALTAFTKDLYALFTCGESYIELFFKYLWDKILSVIKWIKDIPRIIRGIIPSIVKAFYSIIDWFKELPGRIAAFIKEIPSMLIDLLNKIKTIMPAWVIKAFGGTIENKTTTSVGKRASGGPVTSGNPYLVGEQGPELFVPGISGSIIPHDNETINQSSNKVETKNSKISINSLVGTINIYANNSKEAASKFESEIMKVINKLSKNVFAAELGVNL